MNYVNTFIRVAPDTKAVAGTVPVPRGGKKTIAVLEYELISGAPYTHTQEDVQFAVHTRRRGLSAREVKTRRRALWDDFFSKSRACMRTSPLAKTYGWGLHFDAQGRVALVPMESEAYERLAGNEEIELTQAVRSRRG